MHFNEYARSGSEEFKASHRKPKPLQDMSLLRHNDAVVSSSGHNDVWNSPPPQRNGLKCGNDLVIVQSSFLTIPCHSKSMLRGV